MSEILKLPKILKPYSFAKKNLKFNGTYDLCTIEELAENIHRGTVVIDLHFDMLERVAIVTGSIKCNAILTCVNCLDEMEFNARNDLKLAFVDSEKNTTNLDTYDIIHCDFTSEILTLDLIIEEVLLALPMFAKHEDNCIKYVNTTEDFKETQENPFAVLKNTFK